MNLTNQLKTMEKYLRIYKMFLIVLSAFAIVISVYLLVDLAINRRFEFSITKFYLISFFLPVLALVSIYFSYKISKMFFTIELESKLKEELLKSDFTDSLKILTKYLKESFHTNLNVFLLEKDEIKAIVCNFSFDNETLIKTLNSPNITIKKKFNNNGSLFLTLESENSQIMESISSEIDKFLHIIVSKYIFEKEKFDLGKREKYLKKFIMFTELLDKVSHSLVLEEMHYTIISGAMSLFEADKVSLLDVSKGKGNYTFVATINIDYSELKGIEEKINSAYYGEHIDSIVRIGKVNYVQNTFEIPGWYKTIENPESWIGIPLLDLDNKVMYVVSISKNNTNAFNKEDIDFAETFARNVNIVLAKNLLIEKYRWDSITDPLTNLYNRREFEEKLVYEINQYKKYKTPFTLLVLDLDKFKKFNDTFGHTMGDRLLVEFARVLEKVVRKEDSIFRLGGDEFAVILRNTNSKLATQIAERIKLNTQRINLNVPFDIGVSIGIKEYEGESLSDLLKTADSYLYIDKNKIKN